MVIVNFDVEECCQISGDKRANRINRRRGKGIRISALDQVLRNAPSAELDIADLPDFKYSHIYNRTKNFLVSSYERVKDFGKLLNGEEYCAHCREYKRLDSLAGISNEQVDTQASFAFNPSKRFSDSFVEKVQSQHQSEKMPCCAICKRPRPPLEYYCSCQEHLPPRKMHVSCPYRRGSPRTWVKPKKKKPKKWWCCKKKKSENWDQLYCLCDQQKVNRHGQIGPCICRQSPSMFQKFRCYLNGGNSNHRRDDDSYNSYLDEMQCCGGMSKAPCGWCPKGYNIALRQDADVAECSRRPRSERSSIEYMKMEFTEDDYDADTTESDDCCCCCPCRKNYNTTNIQTDNPNCNLLEPKSINTQTESFAKKKRRCCRCCRNGCGICKHLGMDEQCRSRKRQKGSSQRDNERNKVNCLSRPQEECFKNQYQCSPQKSPRLEEPRKKTTILKSASVQHEPCNVPIAETSFSKSDCCPCREMQNVMFGHVKTSPLFLDKMFTSPIHRTRYNLSHKPMHTTHHLHANTFLSSAYSHPQLGLNDDTLSIPESTIPSKTKKCFLNAVCDSILCDLTSRRRNSFSSLIKSPDSGYQGDPQAKRSLFSFKRHRHSNSSSKTKINKLFSNFGAESVESMLKTLNGGKKKDENVMGEASKVVRGVMEEITKNAEAREEISDNLFSTYETHELLKRESLRNMLLGMACSQSDSAGVDLESMAGTSAGAAGAACDDGYLKLLKAVESVRRTKVKESNS